MKAWLRNNSQTLLRLLGTLLGLGLTFVLLRQQGWEEILVALRQVSALELALALGLTLVSRLCVVGRWHVLLRSGGVPIPLHYSTGLTFAGLFASNFLPTTIGGDVLRMAGAMQMGYNRAVCLASIAADRLVGMAGMFMVLPFGLVPLARTLTAVQAAALPMLSAIEGPAPSSDEGSTPWARGKRFLKRTLEALRVWLRKPTALAASFGFTCGHMLCTFLSLSIILGALGEQVPLYLIGGLWSVAYFVTLIPVSINGYGVQELSLVWLFTNVAGVSLTDSLLLALMIRVLQMVASLPGAFYLPSVLAAMDRSRQ
jgi:uncharacterized membrane protein YbhN (UPF0104 family)